MTCLLWWHSHFATAATGHDCTVCPAGGEHWYGSDVGTFSVCNILTQPEAEPVAVRVRTVLCLRSITSGQNQTKTNCWIEKSPLSLFKIQNTQPKNKKTTQPPTSWNTKTSKADLSSVNAMSKNSVSWLNGLCADPDSCLAARVQSECVMTQNDLWVIQFVFVSFLAR